MTERDVREALAEALFRWNTPSDPYFVIHGRAGDVTEGDPYLPIADALLASDALAQMLAEAEQRGREDNADHGMCYVHGSKALDARLAEARAEVLREARDALYRGEGPDMFEDSDIVYGEWLGNRAEQAAGGDQ